MGWYVKRCCCVGRKFGGVDGMGNNGPGTGEILWEYVKNLCKCCQRDGWKWAGKIKKEKEGTEFVAKHWAGLKQSEKENRWAVVRTAAGGLGRKDKGRTRHRWTKIRKMWRIIKTRCNDIQNEKHLLEWGKRSRCLYTGKWNIPEKVRFIHNTAEWTEEEVQHGLNWEFGKWERWGRYWEEVVSSVWGEGERSSSVVELHKNIKLGGELLLNIPSDRTMALGSTQPLVKMSTRNISWG